MTNDMIVLTEEGRQSLKRHLLTLYYIMFNSKRKKYKYN